MKSGLSVCDSDLCCDTCDSPACLQVRNYTHGLVGMWCMECATIMFGDAPVMYAIESWLEPTNKQLTGPHSLVPQAQR